MVAVLSGPTQEAINSFQMPPVRQGMMVRWYQYGEKATGSTTIGFVVRVTNRAIEMRTAEGLFRQTVRHIDDPKLTLNITQRESGAWDYTEEHLFQIALLDELQAKIKSLETTVAALTATAARSGKKPE